MVRGVALMVGLLAAVPAIAGEMSADEARRFVIGKLFNYTCFEGTRGAGPRPIRRLGGRLHPIPGLGPRCATRRCRPARCG